MKCFIIKDIYEGRIKMADLSDEQKRQLKNCYEVVIKYQEKQRMNPKRTKCF